MKPYSDAERVKLQGNLSVIRKIAGWTSADLGELIGVTKQTISNLENDRAQMTKTQYIAIRAMIDYEIATNKNETLAQVVNILLDSEELSEEEQVKVEATMAYVKNAKEKGMNNTMIAVGVGSLIAALGIGMMSLPASGIVAPTTVPTWLESIIVAKKK